MARIRSIKPEFFRHESLCNFSPLHRLLFIGLWTQADRQGRLEDRPKRLKVELLPYDDCEVERLLHDLAAAGFIQRYEVAGQRLISIPKFAKHQRPHPREVGSNLPAPPKHQGSTQVIPGEDLGSTQVIPGEDLGSTQVIPGEDLDRAVVDLGATAGKTSAAPSRTDPKQDESGPEKKSVDPSNLLSSSTEIRSKPGTTQVIPGEDLGTAQQAGDLGDLGDLSSGEKRNGATAPPHSPQAADLRQLWNSLAAPSLPRWKATSNGRMRTAKARLANRPLLDGENSWAEVIRRINASAFCCGENDRGWRASPDWLLKPDTADRVLEGKYDKASPPKRYGEGWTEEQRSGPLRSRVIDISGWGKDP